MIGKAILFWVGVLVALIVLFQFAPATAKSIDHWMDYSPLIAVVLGLAVIIWRRRTRAPAEGGNGDSDRGSHEEGQ
jgi:membrane protein DedA with SNARE-associated domain